MKPTDVSPLRRSARQSAARVVGPLTPVVFPLHLPALVPPCAPTPSGDARCPELVFAFSNSRESDGSCGLAPASPGRGREYAISRPRPICQARKTGSVCRTTAEVSAGIFAGGSITVRALKRPASGPAARATSAPAPRRFERGRLPRRIRATQPGWPVKKNDLTVA